MHVELGQIFTQIVSFLVMLWVLQRYAWKPLLKFLEDRKQKIQSEFNAIEEQQKEVERMKKEYDHLLHTIDLQAKEKIQEALDEGRKAAYKIQEEAHVSAKAILAKAKEDLQMEVAKAKLQLKDEVVKLTMLATQKIIKLSVDEQMQKKMITDFIEKVELH